MAIDKNFILGYGAGKASKTEQTIIDTTEAWLDEHIDPSTGYVLDDTLTLDNAAPPASAVGDLKSATVNKEDFGLFLTNDDVNMIDEADPDFLRNKAYSGTTSSIVTFNFCDITNYIYVPKGNTITLKYYLKQTIYAIKYAIYNASKVWQKTVATSASSTGVTEVSYTATDDCYIRFQLYGNCRPYTATQEKYKAIKISSLESNFYGTKGVAFGTSLTARATNEQTPSYMHRLTELSGIDFDNQGVSSSLITGAMLQAIKAYTSYSDKRICIIEGFVNDWFTSTTLGTWQDNEETTACGCLRSAINYVFSQNPNITVFVILDHYGRNYNSNDLSSTAKRASLTQYEYYNEMAKVAESLGVPVIKEYELSQICENTPQYLGDQIHLNNSGAIQSANAIWSQMRQYFLNYIA